MVGSLRPLQSRSLTVSLLCAFVEMVISAKCWGGCRCTDPCSNRIRILHICHALCLFVFSIFAITRNPSYSSFLQHFFSLRIHHLCNDSLPFVFVVSATLRICHLCNNSLPLVFLMSATAHCPSYSLEVLHIRHFC